MHTVFPRIVSAGTIQFMMKYGIYRSFAGQNIVKTHHCGLGTHDIVNAFWNILEDNFETGICQHFHWFSSRDLKFKMGMNNFKCQHENMDSALQCSVSIRRKVLEKKASIVNQKIIKSPIVNSSNSVQFKSEFSNNS